MLGNMRCLIVALMLPACTLPATTEPPHADMVFVADESLLLAVDRGADQFRAFYPQEIEVYPTVTDADSDMARVVTVRLVTPGFVAPGETLPMCTAGAIGKLRISGYTDSDLNVWICDDMSEGHTQSVVLHEMCHVFGAPGHPHWDYDGACDDDAPEINAAERAAFERVWRK